jgi:hypothetical protein
MFLLRLRILINYEWENCTSRKMEIKCAFLWGQAEKTRPKVVSSLWVMDTLWEKAQTVQEAMCAMHTE